MVPYLFHSSQAGSSLTKTPHILQMNTQSQMFLCFLYFLRENINYILNNTLGKIKHLKYQKDFFYKETNSYSNWYPSQMGMFFFYCAMYIYNKSNMKIVFSEFHSGGCNCAHLETCSGADTCTWLPLTVIGVTHTF